MSLSLTLSLSLSVSLPVLESVQVSAVPKRPDKLPKAHEKCWCLSGKKFRKVGLGGWMGGRWVDVRILRHLI